jgi:hypothetical protein
MRRPTAFLNTVLGVPIVAKEYATARAFTMHLLLF